MPRRRQPSDLTAQVKNLIRLTVAVYAVLVVLIAGVTIYAVITVSRINRVAAKANQAAAESRTVSRGQAKQIKDNQRTIRFLCDQTYVIDDLVQAALVLVRTPPRQPGSEEFIHKFEADHAQLLDGLTREGSPCAG